MAPRTRGQGTRVAAAALGTSSLPTPPPGVTTRVLSAINESTKWVVSGAVAGVLVWLRNEHAAWAVLGAVLSSFVCKLLKHAINQERPGTAVKTDPGMPSSHANSECTCVAAINAANRASAPAHAHVSMSSVVVVTGL